jgi:Xaa-Pro aminopeptidase
MKKVLLILIYYCIIDSALIGQEILSPRAQADWIDSMMEYRFEQMIPEMMDQANIDMWILISREYNEDPIMRTMLPSSWLSARRRTILVFSKEQKTKKVEKVAIARYDVGRLMKGAWNIDVYPDQFEALRDYIVSKDPQKIGLNYSNDFGLADGLIRTEYNSLVKVLPKKYVQRIVSAERLALLWLETRSPMEVTFYKELLKVSRDIIYEAFNRSHITPGLSTTDDVVWHLRKRVADLGLQAWFHPTVSIQRDDALKFEHVRNFSARPKDQIIQLGDLLHVDFGITYMRLNTDQQQHFYVLKENETEVPSFLQEAFAKTNRVQDILTEAFKTGLTGNAILKAALTKTKSEGIEATIYTHPIGFHGHAAGPTIGLWDQQGGVKGSGDYILQKNTAYSIELNAASPIKEWGGKVIKIMLEEDGIWDGNKFYYPDGRQTSIKGI